MGRFERNEVHGHSLAAILVTGYANPTFRDNLIHDNPQYGFKIQGDARGRYQANRIVDNGGVTADAARVMTRLLNALPEWERVSTEKRDGLWRQAIVEQGVKAPSAEAMDVVRDAYDVCRSKDPEQTRFSLRQCLEGRHHKLIWSLNSTYWKSVGGS